MNGSFFAFYLLVNKKSTLRTLMDEEYYFSLNIYGNVDIEARTCGKMRIEE